MARKCKGFYAPRRILQVWILRVFRLFRRNKPKRYICEESSRRAIMRRAERELTKELSFLDSALTIDSLARAVGTNRTYLSQSVRLEKGLAFCEYINSLRIDYAKCYMQSEQAKFSTDEVAIISGFGSKRNFVRQFRRMEGMTPVQYYKRLKIGITMPKIANLNSR